MATKIGSDRTAEGFDILLAAALVEALPDPVIRYGSYRLARHFVEGYQAGAPAVVDASYVLHRDQKRMQCPSRICDASLSILLGV